MTEPRKPFEPVRAALGEPIESGVPLPHGVQLPQNMIDERDARKHEYEAVRLAIHEVMSRMICGVFDRRRTHPTTGIDYALAPAIEFCAKHHHFPGTYMRELMQLAQEHDKAHTAMVCTEMSIAAYVHSESVREDHNSSDLDSTPAYMNPQEPGAGV